MRKFLEKKKEHIFRISIIFHTRIHYAYWNHHCEQVPHHISVLFVLEKALRHTIIIDSSHYVLRKLLFWWINSDVFELHFGAYSRCERFYPYIKGCNSGASQKILWEQVVTCSGHSKEHFKTNLAEYWGGGVHGRSSYLPDYEASQMAYPVESRAPSSVMCSRYWLVVGKVE